jgi:quercetin dioxygenase-like cupin family protein
MTAATTTSRCVALERDSDFRFEREGVASRRRSALVAVVGGLALTAGSMALALAAHSASTTQVVRPAAVVGTPAAVLPNVGTASETYEPGHSSGWHLHPGVHSVVVLSGTLTIYDEHCVRTDYGPGETYLGGNAPHLARNEGADDVNVAITYVYSSTSPTAGTPVAAPVACDVRRRPQDDQKNDERSASRSTS